MLHWSVCNEIHPKYMFYSAFVAAVGGSR